MVEMRIHTALEQVAIWHEAMPYYHTTNHEFAPGDIVIPGGGPTPFAGYYEDNPGTAEEAAQHVWMTNNLSDVLDWQNIGNTSRIYEVEPDKPQRETGGSDWWAPRARVRREVPFEEVQQVIDDPDR